MTSEFSDPDVELMLEFQAGKKKAFNQIFKKYQKRILNLCYKYTGSQQIAEDLAQEVFLKVYLSKDQYVPQENVKLVTYLYRLASNHALNYVRDHKREISASLHQKASRQEDTNVMAVEDLQTNSPLDKMNKAELNQLVKKCIQELPERQKQAIILHQIEFFSYGDIADVMEMTPQSVKSLLARARENLKNTFETELRKMEAM